MLAAFANKGNSQFLMLLHQKMKEQRMLNQKREYYDAVAFDLKGDVKMCCEYSTSKSSDDALMQMFDGSDTTTYEFSRTGEYECIRQNREVVRNRHGFLSAETYTTYDFLANGQATKTIRYEYADGRLVKQREESLCNGKTEWFEFIYQYDERGNQKNMEFRSKTSSTDFTAYEVLETDSCGNWIKRKSVTSYGSGGTTTKIQTRHIVYWDDVIRKIKERRKVEKEQLKEGVHPQEAPTFGLG